GEHVILVGCRGDAERFDAQDLPDVAPVLVRAVHPAAGQLELRMIPQAFDAQELPDVAPVLVRAVHPAAGQLELRMIQHAFDGGLADASGGPLNDTQLGGVTHAWHSMTDWQSLSTTTKGRRMGVLDGKIAIV